MSTEKTWAIPPEGCEDYLTPGKPYEVEWVSEDSFFITVGIGMRAYCLMRGCSHLKNGDWQFVTTHDAKALARGEEGGAA